MSSVRAGRSCSWPWRAFGLGLALAATGEARVSIWFVAAALIIGAVVWLEGGPDSAKEIAVIATLAGAAAAGRVLFAAVPGVQPVTVMTIVAGAALGLRAGVAVGMLAAFVSNFFLAQGPWTPYQMLAWGACGAVGALLAPLLRRRLTLAVVAFVLGLRVQHVHGRLGVVRVLAARRAVARPRLGRGIPFSLAHAIGNFVLAIAVGPELRRLLERYGRRMRAEVVWA